ncbi:MAG: aminoacyl-tRNA hydrolase [Nitrospirales bacterium]|nr:aminoacyl-tRNA hydrolase [Nitrospirales bacterium]
MYAIVGLGNPGEAYEATRHNVGWKVIIQAARQWAIKLTEQGASLQGTGHLGTEPIVLGVPLTWMNQTGWAVKALLTQYDIETQYLIVVYDDLDLNVGRIRIKQRGGAGGHNGLRSILDALQTDEFSRLKIGISRPPVGDDVADYVLSAFTPAEIPIIADTTTRSVSALECLATRGPAEAMNLFNTVNLYEDSP